LDSMFILPCLMLSSVETPTIQIAPGVNLPFVVLGTGSGQHGDVANATATWLSSSTGGVGIDTAYDYDDEVAVGTGVKASGKSGADVFIETKIPCSTYRKAKQAIASNLQQLGVGIVDLTLIHTPCQYGRGSVKETWKALEEAHTAGQTKAIGVSHFLQADLEALMKTATIKPAVNQCELSVSYHDDATIAYCKQQGIVYQSFSPLCGGFNGSSCSMRGGKNVLTVPQVQQIAAAHSVVAAQVGLKWIVQQGLPLTTAVWRQDYMVEDLDLWSFNLTAAEMATLSSVYKPH